MTTIYGTPNSEIINGTDSSDKIFGWAKGGNENSPSGKDTLFGKGGNDELYGGTGRDTLDGGAGVDTLVGGKGDDTYIVDSTTDLIREYEGGGEDTVRSSVSNTLGDWLNNLTLTGNESINGTGNSLNNIIKGNAGDNILKGGAGNDTITGSDGDRLFGEAGNDTLTNNTSFESGRRAYMDGGDGNDVLDGDFAIMHGGNGNDTINGGTSSVIYGENGNDRLDGNESDIYGGVGNDSLSGDFSNLYGGEGDDILRTALSARMEGGNGRDTLIGSDTGDSSGQDYFVFNNLAEGGDTIRNFVADGDGDSRDLIVISANDFGGGLISVTEETPGGSITILAAEQFTIGTGATDASDRFIYNSTNGALFFDIDGTGSTAAALLATLTGAPAITNGNIMLS